MTKTKVEAKGHADRVNSADVVTPQSSSTVGCTQGSAQEAECQSGQEQPIDEFDMATRELAYLKWEAAGFPAGDGFDFWLEAERELRANQRASTTSPE